MTGLENIMAVFVAIAVTAVATRGYLLRSVADQTDDVAKAAATAAAVSLGSREGFYRLYEDEEGISFSPVRRISPIS